MPEFELAVHDVAKSFNPGLFAARRQVLDGLSLEVRRGEVFGFLGPNGAGKTTTIKAITGLIRPDRGEIRIAGLPHTSMAAKRMLGFMPESPYFYNHLRGAEFLVFYGRLLGLRGELLRERVSEVLHRVSMTRHADAAMRTYSKGMLQRVGLAQALIGGPRLLILDEPMSGLDPIGRREVRDIILAERERGTTVFFSTHIIPDVESLCDRVAIISAGRVQAVGAVRSIMAREAESFEVVYHAAEPVALDTSVVSSRSQAELHTVRVAAADRQAMLDELAAAGVRVESLTPVRASLEDFLLEHYRGEEQ